MRYASVGAVVFLSAAAFHVGAAAEQAAERPLSRSLTVEQIAVYDVRPAARPAAAGDAGLEVLAWVDRPDYTYASGEEVQVFVETNKDAYVTVLNVDPAGTTTVLFPNRYQSDNFVTAGRTLRLPDRDEFRIVVSGSVGAELLKVIASTEPVPLFETRQLAGAGPFQVARARSAARLARSLEVVISDTNQPAGGPGSRPGSGGGPPARPTAPFSGSTPAAAAGVTPASAAGEWAMCHQAITTVPTLSAAARRTRSLTVQRTQESSGSVTCEEAG